MFCLQRYYEDKLSGERAGVEIIFNANEMWIDCTEILFLKGYFSLFGGEEPAFAQRVNRIMDQYQILKKLVANNRMQTENLEKIHAYTRQALSLSNQLRPVISPKGSRKMSVLISDLDILAKAQLIVGSMASEIEFFRKPEFLYSRAAVAEVERSTLFVDCLVLGSLAASTIVALLLFAYFIRTISQEIKVIVKNTDQFKEGIELEPPLSGGDELAQVDAAFHQMSDEIKEAQRTKQKILSMISHDLRSPLTSVLGYLSNLRAGVFGDAPNETLANAERCEREIDRLIHLINDLLDLDKIEAGKFELRPKSLSADQVLDKAINKVFRFADERDVNINPPMGMAQIHADPERLLQALSNVLSTAVRLSPVGSSIETGVGQNNGESEIRITAASAEITEDQLDLLFDRYQQSGCGLQLDLPISREILRLHGGSIVATAQKPQGLTFSLLLPAKEPA